MTTPTPPSTPVLDPASDTGVSHADGITQDTAPTITGTATPGDTITLLDSDGTVLGIAQADSTTGAWSIVSATLAEGAHTLTATDTDPTGNNSAPSSPLSITIDTTAPTAPATPALATSVPNTGGVTQDTTPTLVGNATPGDTVTLLDTDGTTVLGTAQADTTGAWSITSAPLTQGLHTLTVTDTDTAGNISAASGSLSVTITSILALDPASDTGVSNSDGITRDTAPTITGIATPGALVTLLDTNGTTVLGTAQADTTTGAWSLVSAPLTEGTHTLSTTVTTGNTSVASGTLSVTINTTAPTAPATLVLDPASDTGVSNTDGITQDTTPTIDGTATPGGIITLLDTNGTTVLGTALVNSAGVWSIMSAPLAEGSHTLTATDTDTAGNISASSSPLVVTINTTAPAAPATLVLDPASDTGVSNTDGITRATTPTITGTGTPGDSITLLDSNGTALGLALADTTGAWSIVSAPLAEGAHILTATDTDTAGNTSIASGPLSVTIDTIAPAAPATPVLDTSVPNTGGITQDTTPTIVGGATPGDTVTLLDSDGTTVLGTAQVDTTGAWSIVSAPLALGAHTLTATDTDTAGNISAASGTLSVTIDTTVPTAPATPVLASASDTGVSNTDGITRATTPTITGTATPGDLVTLLDTNGTTVLGTAQADTTGAWSIVSAPLAEGAHTLTAKDTNPAGNTSALSSPLVVTIDTIEPAAPATPVLAPTSDTGVFNTDGITRDTTPTITGAATPGDLVTLLDTDGTTVLGTAQADTTGAWSIVSAPLAEGAHTLTATDTDTAGNTSTVSGPLVVTIDTIAPAAPAAPVLDTSVPNTGGVTQDTTPTIVGTATPGDNVTLLDTDGTTVLGTAQVNGTGTWLIASATLAPGTHALTATDTDIAGNISAASSPLSVTIDTLPPIGPIPPLTPVLAPASDTGVSNTDGITRDTTPTITGAATPGDLVTLLDTNGTTVLGTAQADTTGVWSIVSAPLAEGAHTLTATDTNPAGNTSAPSGPLVVTIDTIAPAAPGIPVLNPASDTGISNTDGITRATTPTITGSATPGDIITLLDTNGTVRGTAKADTTGAWSIVSAMLAEGTHTLTATDTDPAGNTSVASGLLSVTINTTAPAAPPAPVLAPGVSNTNGVTQDTTPTITGTATPGDTVTLLDTNGTTVLGTAQANPAGAWLIASATLAEGAHTLTATDTNTAGNTSAASGILPITINTTGSVTPVVTPTNTGFTAIDPSTGQSISLNPLPYSGPVPGIQSELIDITSANLNITVTAPNSFVHSGSGDDALTVTSGNNILDGGGGSNFLVGGTGSDTFFVDARGASASIWSTVGNFHTGDSATMWGASPTNFIFTFEDNQGAAGYTGLTVHAIAPDNKIFSVTFVGLTKAALGNGTLSESFGTDPVSGSQYTYFHAN